MLMCIMTTLNNGLRSGGGIGDILRKPKSTVRTHKLLIYYKIKSINYISPPKKEPFFYFRILYDLLFFFVIIIITMNLIFGVIIDTFGDLRQEKQERDNCLKNTCFICGNYNNFRTLSNPRLLKNIINIGLDRAKFDNKTVSFDEHIRLEHNMWHYLYFLIMIKVKDKTEFTGQESYVYSCIQVIKGILWS